MEENALNKTLNLISTNSLKVLLIGSAGWLAQFVYQALTTEIYDFNCEIHCTFHNSHPPYDTQYCHHLDLDDELSVKSVIEGVVPNVIIHLAAISSPLTCHNDTTKATSINRPKSLIEAVHQYAPEALFIFSSTDLVYDGDNAPYHATIDPDPQTVYGSTKLAFEHLVLELKNGIVLRLSNMLGPNYCFKPVGVKFLQFLTESYHKRDYIGLRYDEIRSFVRVYDVVLLIKLIVNKYTGALFGRSSESASFNGIFNVGGPHGLSRLEVAKLVCDFFGGEFIVHESKQSPGSVVVDSASNSVAPWIVYKTSNAESVSASGIKNPRDVTMLSRETEQMFGFTFTDISNLITYIHEINSSTTNTL
jgi:dTDP-4-dehydrorhamnose reductase